MRTHKRKVDRVAEIKHLVNALSQELLSGNFGDGDTSKVSVGETAKLVFTK
jgi:hypothetical protein